MMDHNCCGDCENCTEHHDKHGMKMACCENSAMSEENLEINKKMSKVKSKTVKNKLSKK